MKTNKDDSINYFFEGKGINYGLTKREYFAACALQGFCATSYTDEDRQIAQYCVDLADELIKALNK